jgi:hypothetical protein
MSRILVMEDNTQLREDLVEEIRILAPFIRIDESDRIEDGLEFIRTASARHMPYDAAVLDFKLHSDDSSRHQQIDEQLCLAIRRMMHDCLVVHVTGHKLDPIVEAHEKRCHIGVRQPRSLIIQKEGSYIVETAGIICSWVNTKPVHNVLDALFHVPRLHGGVGGHGRVVTRSASHLLARLEHWVACHWDALDEPTQSRVLAHFEREGDHLVLYTHHNAGANR